MKLVQHMPQAISESVISRRVRSFVALSWEVQAAQWETGVGVGARGR